MKARLIAPVWVTIEQADPDNTVMHPYAREPVKQVSRREPLRIKAQVSFSASEDSTHFRGGQGGKSFQASGHLVFLVSTLEARGIVLKHGDRVIQIGKKTCEYYLDGMEYAAHNRGTAELEVWDFIDHNPTNA